MEPGRKLRADRRIGVQRGRDSVRGPPLEKSFAHGDPGTGRHAYARRVSNDCAPAARSKFAQRIVLRANPLQIQKQVPLVRAILFPARRKRSARAGRLLAQTLAESFGHKDKIRRQEDVGGSEKRVAGRVEFLPQRFIEPLFRRRLLGSAFPANREGARRRVPCRRHRASAEGLAPRAKKLFGKPMTAPAQELFHFRSGPREFLLPND